MSKPRSVYDIITQRELTVDAILNYLVENIKKQNWKLVNHYLQLLVKSIGHLLV
ncbi:MAG: hypothetical protein NDF57_05150 [archaeon GBS-70-058]|nr:hypothetical protein [Candidatus Culexarchaeum nevadense]